MNTNWNNIIIAESEDAVVIENNHYFSNGSIKNRVALWRGVQVVK